MRVAFYVVLVLSVIIAGSVLTVEINNHAISTTKPENLQNIYSVTETSETRSSNTQTALASADPQDCDLTSAQALSRLGEIPTNVMNDLNPLYYCQSESKPNYRVYPILLMNKTSVGEINALYSFNGAGTPTANSYPQIWQLPDLGSPNATVLETPLKPSHSFDITNATMIWENNSTIEYKYSIQSLPNSTGYYDITLPSSCGYLQVPLVVGINASMLSGGYLDELGYDGNITCAGPGVPGLIVEVMNVSITYVMIATWGSH